MGCTRCCRQILNYLQGGANDNTRLIERRCDSFIYLNLSHNLLTSYLEQLHYHNAEYLDLKFNFLQGCILIVILEVLPFWIHYKFIDSVLQIVELLRLLQMNARTDRQLIKLITKEIYCQDNMQKNFF